MGSDGRGPRAMRGWESRRGGCCVPDTPSVSSLRGVRAEATPPHSVRLWELRLVHTQPGPSLRLRQFPAHTRFTKKEEEETEQVANTQHPLENAVMVGLAYDFGG